MRDMPGPEMDAGMLPEAGEEPLPESDGPERSCIVTRVKGPPEALLRFVVGPDGAVVPDVRAKLPGRGAWVTGEAGVLAEALRRKSFKRAFKREVMVSPDVVAMVDTLLERDALQALSLANKAGLVVAGSAKVEAAAGSRRLAALIHALDGSVDGTRKIEASMRRQLGEGADSIERVQIFRSDQLDLALGRTNVIHAALAVGSASKGFISRSQRLDRFRCGSPQAMMAAGPHGSIDE